MSYYETLGSVDPGIDVSHYGAPYQGMLGLGQTSGWTGAPAEDPRMLKRYSVIRSTYRVTGLGGSRTAAAAADAILAAARQQFPGQSVTKVGSSGWIAGGRVAFELTLSSPMRAGLAKSGNHAAGTAAAQRMGGGVRFVDGRTIIPGSAFDESASPPGAPPPASETTSTEDAGSGSRKILGLPVWGVALIGVGLVGGVAAIALRPKHKPVTANRRRRRRTSRRRSR